MFVPRDPGQALRARIAQLEGTARTAAGEQLSMLEQIEERLLAAQTESAAGGAARTKSTARQPRPSVAGGDALVAHGALRRRLVCSLRVPNGGSAKRHARPSWPPECQLAQQTPLSVGCMRLAAALHTPRAPHTRDSRLPHRFCTHRPQREDRRLVRRTPLAAVTVSATAGQLRLPGRRLGAGHTSGRHRGGVSGRKTCHKQWLAD